MKEKEFKRIIDREKHRREATQVFSKQIEVIVDLVNYGSNLLVRSYDSSKKRLEDSIVIGVLLKQVISMVDAIETLASSGSPQIGHLQFARSSFFHANRSSCGDNKFTYFFSRTSGFMI